MRLLLCAVLVVIACGPSVSMPDGGAGAFDSGFVEPDAGKPDAGALDHSAAGLIAFVKSGRYQSWRAEAAVHASTGPHGGNVRTWVNDVLYASLKAGNTTHPPGSVAVKELYGTSTTQVTGHAIDAKDAQGTWFFLEAFAPSYASPYYFSGTSSFCAGCHSAGPDFYAGKLLNLP